jgi:diguanylate cyclase (GGDEF)-like protein
MRDARIRTLIRLAAVPGWTLIVAGVAAAVALGALACAWLAGALVAALVVAVGFSCLAAALHREVRKLADRDPMTGVASRSRFADALRRAVDDSTKSGGPLTVAVLDCDDFKQINEQFGHTVGDAVLVAVADVLSQTVGPVGTVGRLWGDAFGIVLPGMSLETGHCLLEEAKACLRARMIANDWSLTFSIGILCQNAPTSRADDLLAEADALMFSVKRRGRNGIACCSLLAKSSTLTEQESPELARQP